MASTIKLKRGSGEPGAGDLLEGEPAFDLTNKRLYTENSGGTVLEIGTNPTTLQVDGTLTVGVDDTGYDVEFFGATSGKSLLWDQSADSLIVTGSTSQQGTLTVGVDDTGYDVKFFGATSGKSMLWDESADSLIVNGTVDVVGTVTADGLTVNADTSTFTSANASDPLVIIKNTANDASGARLSFQKDKGANAADGDDIGTITFIGDNNAQEQTNYASIVVEVSESQDTDEAGKMSFFVAESNGTTSQLTAGLIIEGEHATDGEVDVTIAAGASSTTTVAGLLNTGGNVDVTGTVTANPSGGVVTLGANGHITSKQSLDVATAGGRYIGSSNRGILGQIKIEQTATGADGGYIEFDTSSSGSTTPTTRMTIDSSGNVGIGVTSPVSPLTVRGSFAYASSASNLETSTTKSAVRIQGSSDASTSLWIGVDTTDAQPYLQVANAAGTGSDDLLINPFGGNVGIGTTAPATLLHIGGASTPNTLTIESNTESSINFKDSGGSAQAFKIGTSVSGNTNNLEIYDVTDSRLVATFDGAGNVGIGTDSPSANITIDKGLGGSGPTTFTTANSYLQLGVSDYNSSGGVYAIGFGYSGGATHSPAYIGLQQTETGSYTKGDLVFRTRSTSTDVEPPERMRIDSSGRLLVGSDISSIAVQNTEEGVVLDGANGRIYVTANAHHDFNRTADGEIIRFRSATNTEGSISVSGTTVSYNGGHLSRWSQLLNNTVDATIVKGTVMTNLDEMSEWSHDAIEAQDAVYDEEGNVVTEAVEAKEAYTEDNEQLNKMAVSSVEGDPNVAGVFVNWDEDDDMNIAMTGDMVIRIAQGTTIQRGDLLMSAGDGTAKTQADDIVRSKTIAKVTSTHISHTYDDGSYLVPCVIMAC